MAFVWKTRVRFVDTDASRRIHYTALFRFFEAAEQEFLRSLEQGYPGISGDETGWPRVHAECDISGAIVFDDELTIEVSVNRVGNSSLELAFRAMKNEQECGRGKVVIVCLDVPSGKSKPLPAAFAAALRRELTQP